jgi:predicted nucleic acid-binding protein
MYYFDANVFIFPQIYEHTVDEVLKAKEYLVKLAEGDVEGCTSTLTWDEVVYAVRKSAGREESIIAGRKFLSFPNLKIYSIDFEIVLKAQEIVENYNVKPRDAIHAACALKFCNGKLISNDSDFDVINGVNRIF